MRQRLFSSTTASHFKMNKIFCSRCCFCCGCEEKSQRVGNSLLFFLRNILIKRSSCSSWCTSILIKLHITSKNHKRRRWLADNVRYACALCSQSTDIFTWNNKSNDHTSDQLFIHVSGFTVFGELVVRVTQSIQISELCRLNFLKIEMRHSEVTSADVNKCYHTTECIIK